MPSKYLGASLVILGCTGFGTLRVAFLKKQEHSFLTLIQVILYMQRDLQCRLTPLPDLCRQIGKKTAGPIGSLFLTLALEMDRNSAPDVSGCMRDAVRREKDLPMALRPHLFTLAQCLGQYDPQTQLMGLQTICGHCQDDLEVIRKGSEPIRRNSRTVGICAGIALVVLLV